MKLMPASKAASTQARAGLVADAAAVGQPRAEADLRHLQVTVAELSVSHGDRSYRGRHSCRRDLRVPWAPVAKAAALQHVCTECGTSSGRWLGRCPGCGEFGTMVAEAVPSRARRSRPGGRRGRRCASSTSVAEEAERISTGVAGARPRARRRARARVARARRRRARRRQVDAAALRALGAISRDRRALLVTGEESVAQVKLRAARLGGCDAVEILAETELDAVCATLERERPGGLRDRLGADALVAGDRLGARLGRAGARGGRRGCCASRRRAASRRSSSGT